MSFPRSARCSAFVTVAALVTLAAAAPPARAQAAPNAEAAAEVRKRFLLDLDTLQAKFLALANAIPAEKYSWRPGEGVRSVGEAFMHVASEYYVFTPMAYGAPASPVVERGAAGFKKFEGMSTKGDVIRHLTEGFAFMKKSVESIPMDRLAGEQQLFGGPRTIVETSFIMSGDLHEHLGQLIAYSRSIGVVPPWSK